MARVAVSSLHLFKGTEPMPRRFRECHDGEVMLLPVDMSVAAVGPRRARVGMLSKTKAPSGRVSTSQEAALSTSIHPTVRTDTLSASGCRVGKCDVHRIHLCCALTSRLA